jgi:Zn-dependent protease
MMPTRQGSFHLFRFAGIDVFLHWSWFVVAAYQVSSATNRARGYPSAGWYVLEYLTLFLIVLLHEFGHALACRQVGGRANQIVLWPLGGVAYVDPPQRPGAMLWSIVAGPLVNVVLFPVLTAFMLLSRSLGSNAHAFLSTVWFVNCLLLVFNLLPIYPLDGGQILRSLLWFAVGRARSLMATTLISFVGVAALIAVAVLLHSVWYGILSVFILLNCWGGLLQARALARVANAPRREGSACPACKTAPPMGAFWLCGRCRQAFDTFATQAVCPHCGAQFGVTRCLDCGGLYPMSDWIEPPPLPPKT